MPPQMPQMPETIGAEIELEHVPPSISGQLNDVFPHQLFNDGSLRHPVYEINGMPFVYKPGEAPSYAKRVPDFGTELVSKPLTVDKMRVALRHTSAYLSHVPPRPASSIHFHVDVANVPWWVVQNVFLWTYHLEAVLFRLACHGETHRGEGLYKGKNDRNEGPNDYRFTRPLSAPICVHFLGRDEVMAKKFPPPAPGNVIDNRLLKLQMAAAQRVEIKPLVDMRKLLAATSASEMLAAWGRMDLYWNAGMEHYVPHRLHMINPVAIMRHGCMEWRLTDGRYAYMDVMLDAILGVHRLAVQNVRPDFAPMLLGSTPDVDDRWVSDLLGVDVSPLWGNRWPDGVASLERLSHYQQMQIQGLDIEDVNWVNNGTDIDNGKRDYILYRRRNRV